MSNVKFGLFDFLHEGTVEVGELSWVQGDITPNDPFQIYKVNWPKGRKGILCPARIVATSDDRRILIEKMNKYIDGEDMSSPEHGKGKRKKRRSIRLWSESEEEKTHQPDNEKRRKKKKNSSSTDILRELKNKETLQDEVNKSTSYEQGQRQNSPPVTCERCKSLREENRKLQLENQDMKEKLKALKLLPGVVQKLESLMMADPPAKKPNPIPAMSTSDFSNLSVSKDSGPEEGTVLTKALLERCSLHNPQKFVNDLLHGLYTREFMASHSVTGVQSSKGTEVKPAIPKKDLEEITRAAKARFAFLTDSSVRSMIRQKLNNAAKILNKNE